MAQLNLGATLSQRFGDSGRREDLDRALTLGEELVRHASADLRPAALSNLAARHLAAYEHLDRSESLDWAIVLLTEAASQGHEDRGAAVANLGSAYLLRYQRDGDVADLIRRGRRACERLTPGRSRTLVW